MACTGCVCGTKFVRDPGYTGINPVIDPLDFTPFDGTVPDGSCVGSPCHQANPCSPAGCIEASNCFPGPVDVNYRNLPGGSTWSWYHLISGGSMLIPMAGDVPIECGGQFLMASVWDKSQTPAQHLGDIFVTCSACAPA